MRLLLVLFSFFIFQSTFSQESAKEIVQKADDKLRGKSSYAEATMKIVRPDWSREIGMKMWSLGTKRSMVLITSPARDKGMATLMRDKEIWNWQPTIERVVKLPPSMMMQSWMGSDFTNDDLVKQSSIVNDYSHKKLKDTTVQGYQCHKIELIPNEGAPVVWGKIELYISAKEYHQLMAKFYDEDGFLVNTMIASNVQMMGGKKIPAHMEMIPAENPNQKTVFDYQKMEFDVDINDGFFSLQNMKRVR